jgi:hypothetical protein
MIQSLQEFKQRMRHDRVFRRRVLESRQAGTLAETLAQEGYEFDLNRLNMHLPQVHTGINAGASVHPQSCYCMISILDEAKE